MKKSVTDQDEELAGVGVKRNGRCSTDPTPGHSLTIFVFHFIPACSVRKSPGSIPVGDTLCKILQAKYNAVPLYFDTSVNQHYN